MSQDAQPQLSLLSLSIAAANAAPIPATESVAIAVPPRSSHAPTTKHRRISSAGRSRRRFSDARDAATRPFPTSLQTASASLAALSLSSPTVSHRQVNGAQPIQVPQTVSARDSSGPEPTSTGDTLLSVSLPQSSTPLPSNSVNGVKSARKRGTIFVCESCSKVYRHPSCLIKHRWEHTPHWQEASKFVLSKHQQVQLLEAAAILSHLSPSSASLPEDRSLWPSFLSGGLVPPRASVPNTVAGVTPTTGATTLPTSPSSVHPVSSPVPIDALLGSRAGSTGPRLHDYSIGSGVTQLRPGILGVSAASTQASSPLPVATQETSREDDALNLLALRSASIVSGSWGSSTSTSASLPSSSSFSHARPYVHAHSLSYSHSSSPSYVSKERQRRRSNAYEYGSAMGSGPMFGSEYSPGTAAHAYGPGPSNGRSSLPSSSVRSKSGSSGTRSRSQSASESRSDDEDDGAFGDVDVRVHVDGDLDLEHRTRVGPVIYGPRVRMWKTEHGDGSLAGITTHEDDQDDMEDDRIVKGADPAWDGMEMEMEMEMD